MTYVPKVFTSGAVLPALSLNELDGNIDHVREESNYQTILTQHKTELVTTLGGAGNLGFRLILDGATYLGTPAYGTGAKVIADIGLGGVTVGLHYIRLSGVRESGGSIVENFSLPGVARFVRTPDLNYLTLWATFVSYSGSIWTMADVTLIGHREVKGW